MARDAPPADLDAFDVSPRGGRRTAAFDPVRRAARVRLVRTGLIGAAALALVTFVGAVTLRILQPASFEQADLVQGDTLVITAPRFEGRTSDGRRFVVTARSASRRIGQTAAPVSLDGPKLELADGGGMTARSGVWSPGADGAAGSRLVLSGDVEIRRSEGDVGRAAEAVWTPEPDVLAMSGGVTIDLADQTRATSQVAVWRGAERSLSLEGGANLRRPDGSSAAGARAVWDERARTLLLDGGASVSTADGANASARTATWDTGADVVALTGETRLTREDLVAASETARFDRRNARLSGAGKVVLQSKLGYATGDRYVYELDTRRLRMSGSASVTVNRSR